MANKLVVAKNAATFTTAGRMPSPAGGSGTPVDTTAISATAYISAGSSDHAMTNKEMVNGHVEIKLLDKDNNVVQEISLSGNIGGSYEDSGTYGYAGAISIYLTAEDTSGMIGSVVTDDSGIGDTTLSTGFHYGCAPAQFSTGKIVLTFSGFIPLLAAGGVYSINSSTQSSSAGGSVSLGTLNLPGNTAGRATMTIPFTVVTV